MAQWLPDPESATHCFARDRLDLDQVILPKTLVIFRTSADRPRTVWSLCKPNRIFDDTLPGISIPNKANLPLPP